MYGNELKSKAKEMLLISGFNTNRIKLDEIKSTFHDSIDLQVNI